MNLLNLSEPKVRRNMINEINLDVGRGKLYISDRLSPRGKLDYLGLLTEAALKHDDQWLADQLRQYSRMEPTYLRRRPKGGLTTSKMPWNAPDTLAEGEVNRFYARGLCLSAIEDGIPFLVIYRAKEVENPRTESIQMIGAHVDPGQLLEDLRNSIGMDTALRLPPGPNSGLSVRFP